jgi:lipoprotein-releasing system ATP-binding protein
MAAQEHDRVVLELRALRRELGDKVKQTILHGIDLTVHRGEFVALTGHSGSGKSTLLYLLGTLDRPTSGQVIIDGVDTSGMDDNERARLRNERLGFVFQFHFLLPEFTVVENVMIPMLRRGMPRARVHERAEQTLSQLALGHLSRRLPGELSGGQQQRVSIARALAGGPTLLLADEPTGNLDSTNGELVFDLFERLNREQGMTIIMVTHDPDFAVRASRQVMLKDGRILSDERRQAERPAAEEHG